ncbi:MAG: hypothetical protein BYD32DRAFT_31188 [Podila humilis]|nr:MAG: hypothetical protein BYD32DRAFT_31188 [Podila humilis]
MKLTHFFVSFSFALCLYRVPALHFFFPQVVPSSPNEKLSARAFFSQPSTPNGALCDTFSEARKRAWIILNSHWSRGVGICQWDVLTKFCRVELLLGYSTFLRLCPRR